MVAVSSVVDQNVEARGSKPCEGLFHAIDNSIERSDVAGIERQRNGSRSLILHRGYDCLRTGFMAVITEVRLDSAFSQALNGIAANTPASAGDDSDLVRL